MTFLFITRATKYRIHTVKKKNPLLTAVQTIVHLKLLEIKNLCTSNRSVNNKCVLNEITLVNKEDVWDKNSHDRVKLLNKKVEYFIHFFFWRGAFTDPILFYLETSKPEAIGRTHRCTMDWTTRKRACRFEIACLRSGTFLSKTSERFARLAYIRWRAHSMVFSPGKTHKSAFISVL